MHLKVEMYSAGQYTLCHENNKNLVKSGIKFYRLNCEDNPNVSIHCMLFPYGYTTFYLWLPVQAPKVINMDLMRCYIVQVVAIFMNIHALLKMPSHKKTTYIHRLLSVLNGYWRFWSLQWFGICIYVYVFLGGGWGWGWGWGCFGQSWG